MLHLSDGEYWLILPRYPGTALEVSQLDINTSEARLAYSDPDCEALILQCNISDIFPDAEIRLRCEEGEAEFSPYISLQDGSVVLGRRVWTSPGSKEHPPAMMKKGSGSDGSTCYGNTGRGL